MRMLKAFNEPGMGVSVLAGEYMVKGRTVRIAGDVELSVRPPERITVQREECSLLDEVPKAYRAGTMLERTVGPVDTFLRLPEAIVFESVRLYSENGCLYTESADYQLDHYWGGVCRVKEGRIPEGSKVLADYQVYLQRIDLVQLDLRGIPAVKEGESVQACPTPPEPDSGCIPLAHLFLPYRTSAVTDEHIYPLPETDTAWTDFIKASGRENLTASLRRLKSGEPLTVACWGDSVTEGYSATPREKSYVELFKKGLKHAWPGSEITVVNAGINGSSTVGRLAAFDEEVLSCKPHLITAEFVNDTSFPLEKCRSSWTEFIDRAREHNPDTEIIIITPAFKRPDWMGGFHEFVNMQRELAREKNVAIADAAFIWENLKSLGIPYESLLSNLINHPNNLGHQFFAKTLLSLLCD